MADNRRDNLRRLGDELMDREVFKRTVPEPTASDLFTVPFAIPEERGPAATDAATPVAGAPRLTYTQTLLLAAIVLVVTLLGVSILRGPAPRAGLAEESPVADAEPVGEVAGASSPALVPGVPPVAASAPATQPVSLEWAESRFAEGSFDAAYRAYLQLHTELGETAVAPALRDFLVLRMALCAKALNQSDVRDTLLKRVAQSRSPVLATLARYHQCLQTLRDGRWLRSRALAYQALALADAVSTETPWAERLRRNCRFFVGQATTLQALALRDADHEVPEPLWRVETPTDPFRGLDETQLQALLDAGRARVEESLLGPCVERSGDLTRGVLWQVACQGASLEEVLTRFAARAGMDVDWSFDAESGKDRLDPVTRQRPVRLLLTDASTETVVETLVGCAGLFANVDRQGVIHVSDGDPALCASLSDCSQQWADQAMAAWQRLMWAGSDTHDVPRAHFALGLLREALRRPSEAVAEYRLLADRFPHAELAPYALLQSSRIKAGMADYLGARQDLKILVDQYPDVDFADQALLSLAQATRHAGMLAEAYRLFARVYNQADRPEIRLGATLGAGRCSLDQGYYANAARWLVTYLDLADEQAGTASSEARLLLGRTLAAMGQQEKATRVFRDVLDAHPEPDVYWQAFTAYVETCLARDAVVEALEALETRAPKTRRPERDNESALLKARVYRALGLAAKGYALLNDRLPRIPDRQQRARAYAELGAAAVAMEDYAAARRCYSEVLVLAEPGPLSLESSLSLAAVCLKLDQRDRTLALCARVLAAQPAETLRQRALGLQAKAYLQSKSYERAAQTLLDQITPPTPAAPETAVSEGRVAAATSRQG